MLEFPGKRRMLGLRGPRWSKVVVTRDGVAFHGAGGEVAFSWRELTAKVIRVDRGVDSITDDWHMEFAGGDRVCRLEYDDLADDHVRRLIELVRARIPEACRLQMPGSITGEYEGHAKAARQFLKKEQYEHAEKAVQAGLERCERTFGPDDPYVATMLETYAIVLERMGRGEQARDFRRRAQAIRANPWKFFE